MAHSYSGRVRTAARILAAAAFLCCLLFACALAEEDDVSLFTWRILEDRTVCITGWNSDGDTVVIPETIEGRTVTEIGDGAFRNHTAAEQAGYGTLRSAGAARRRRPRRNPCRRPAMTRRLRFGRCASWRGHADARYIAGKPGRKEQNKPH